MLISVFFALLATPARLVSVTDGDTFRARIGGETVRVRLYGINAPERDHPLGSFATRRLEEILPREAIVVPLGTDPYGRTLAWVAAGPWNVNERLVETGAAWWFRRYAPHSERLRSAEKRAKSAGQGVWNDASPLPAHRN